MGRGKESKQYRNLLRHRNKNNHMINGHDTEQKITKTSTFLRFAKLSQREIELILFTNIPDYYICCYSKLSLEQKKRNK